MKHWCLMLESLSFYEASCFLIISAQQEQKTFSFFSSTNYVHFICSRTTPVLNSGWKTKENTDGKRCLCEQIQRFMKVMTFYLIQIIDDNLWESARKGKLWRKHQQWAEGEKKGTFIEKAWEHRCDSLTGLLPIVCSDSSNGKYGRKLWRVRDGM